MNTVPSVLSTWLLALLLVGCATLSAIADILIHYAAKDSTWRPFLVGSLLSIGSLILLRIIFQASSHSFSIVIVLVVVLHLMIDVGFDLCVYRNKLSQSEWIGIALAIGALFLLSNGKHGQ